MSDDDDNGMVESEDGVCHRCGTSGLGVRNHWPEDCIQDLRETVDALRAKTRAQATELREAWRALGTTAEEAADDPDTATLSQSIRISLEHELNVRDQLREDRDEWKALANNYAVRLGLEKYQ